MESILIRAATAADIPGICHVNRGEKGPWAAIDSCRAYVMNRIKQGFYVQVAESGGRVIGHGEWTVSAEKRWRTFYLGQLQVDPDCQRTGVGRRMIADGIDKAHALGCESVSLIPEQDTGSQLFYGKCGFAKGRDIISCALPAESGPIEGTISAEAPRNIAETMPFIFGLTQTASLHMWQVYNRRPEGEGRMVDTLMGNDFCLQLGGFSKQRPALLLAWYAGNDIPRIIHAARAFAHRLGYPGARFVGFDDLVGYFPKPLVETDNYEMYMNV